MSRRSHLGPAMRAVLLPSVAVVEGVDHRGARVVETMTVRPVPWWNNIRRAWMVDGPNGPVLVDPQPPPPVIVTSITHVPPAVKVTA